MCLLYVYVNDFQCLISEMELENAEYQDQVQGCVQS